MKKKLRNLFLQFFTPKALRFTILFFILLSFNRVQFLYIFSMKKGKISIFLILAHDVVNRTKKFRKNFFHKSFIRKYFFLKACFPPVRIINSHSVRIRCFMNSQQGFLAVSTSENFYYGGKNFFKNIRF